jgi:YidC/Oxa1 family membrane protein insertase
VKECIAAGKGGLAQSLPYFLLVALIIVTQYYMSKQMMARATGPQLQQQQMMTRIMPLFLGYISLNIPSGANIYFLVQNVWMVGQQHIQLKQQPVPGAPAPAAKAPAAQVVEERPAIREAPGRPHPASKKRKRKKKRR